MFGVNVLNSWSKLKLVFPAGMTSNFTSVLVNGYFALVDFNISLCPSIIPGYLSTFLLSRYDNLVYQCSWDKTLVWICKIGLLCQQNWGYILSSEHKGWYMFPNKSTVLLSSKSFDLEYQPIFCPSRSGSSMALGVSKTYICEIYCDCFASFPYFNRVCMIALYGLFVVDEVILLFWTETSTCENNECRSKLTGATLSVGSKLLQSLFTIFTFKYIVLCFNSM